MHTYRINYYVMRPTPDGQLAVCYITTRMTAPTPEAAQAQARAAESRPIHIVGTYQEI